MASGPDAGAIAYDDAALAALPATGIPTTAKTQWLMATAQALPALAYLPVPAPAPAPAGPSTAHATVKVKAPHKVHAGHAVKLKVTGLKKHEKVKLKVRGKKVAKGKAKANGKYKAKVVFKGKLAKKGKAVIVAKAASGTAKTTIKVVR